MREIVIQTGETITVDDADFDRVAAHKWSAKKQRNGYLYVCSHWRVPGQGMKYFSLSRFIIDPPASAKVDHRDGCGLHNHRDNLRVTTVSGNACAFQRKRLNCTSRFRGVHWNRSCSRWVAMVQKKISGQNTTLYSGRFSDELAAAQAYNEKALEMGFAPEALNVFT